MGSQAKMSPVKKPAPPVRTQYTLIAANGDAIVSSDGSNIKVSY